MRKVLLSMLVLALAVPAFAAEIALVDNEDGTVSITIDSAEAVRGLALKVTLTDGATLVDPDGAAVNEAFNTFIDYAFEMEAVQPGQFDIGDGHPFALVNEPGTVGAGATEFSISMGVLDQSGNQAGFQTTGAEVLITFQTGAGVVTVGLDTLRGGIVGDVALDSNLDDADIAIVVTDEPTEPECWGYARFGEGDGNGDGVITFADLQILINAWTPNPYNPCADFNKDGVITFADLQILINNWPQ